MQENFSEYNRTMQNANMTVCHLAQMREVEIRSRLQEKVESAQIEVAKKAQIEAICTFEKRKREEDRANIASLRCLQKTEIILTNDGEVEIRKELFGATKTDRSNFRIVNFTILQTQLQDEEKEVLLIEFNSAGRSKNVFLDTSKLSPNQFSALHFSYLFSHFLPCLIHRKRKRQLPFLIAIPSM